MRIIFCNVTYLRYYDGRVAGELKPKKGGRWVHENEDAHEKWNFLNMDGKCYGYVQGNSEQMHIEKLDKVYSQQNEADDITVIWCASNEENRTVVIGWYEHATVYRYLQDMSITPVTGIERCYWFSTKAENAYLLPEKDRVLEIGRASKTGAGTGFGQQNYWYAESQYAKENIIPVVLEFIERNRDERINTLNVVFEQPEDLSPLSEEELDYIEDLRDEGNDREYLPYTYRMYANEPTADNAYAIADTLRNLFQYERAIPWYEKTLEMDPDDWETAGLLAYVYSQCGKYEKTIQMAEKLLTFGKASEPDVRDELYCMLADAHFFNGDVEEAVSWQDKILKESKNKDLLEHTKEIQKKWKGNL